MDILQAIQKGKEFRTKSGFRAKFVALLPENIPARLVMDVYYQRDLVYTKAGTGFGNKSSHIPCMENYYLDGKHVSPYDAHMDLMIDEL